MRHYSFNAPRGGSAAVDLPAAAAPGAQIDARDWNLVPWLYPTSDWKDFEKYGSVALPAAAGGLGSIVQFVVPVGRFGIITAIGINVTANGGAAFVPDVIPYQLTFNLLLNMKPFPGDWGTFNYVPGSVSVPDGISGLQIREGQTITLQVTNNTLVQSTQFVGGRIKGYYYGKVYQPKIMGSQ